jgi:hypothetical protein
VKNPQPDFRLGFRRQRCSLHEIILPLNAAYCKQ